MFFHWKWSIGEPYEKSYKYVVAQSDAITNANMNTNANTNTNANINNFVKESKREDIDEKLSNRTMIAQIGLNPFYQNSNYGNDIQFYDSVMKNKN